MNRTVSWHREALNDDNIMIAIAEGGNLESCLVLSSRSVVSYPEVADRGDQSGSLSPLSHRLQHKRPR